MGRQFRPPRKGGSGPGGTGITMPTLGVASSAAVQIPNYGLTDVSTWAGGDYVLDAPEAGCHKWIVSCSSIAAVTSIWSNTTAGANASVFFDRQGRTKFISPNTTAATWAIELYGLNSTQWVILNVAPYTTDAATPQST